MTAADQLLAGQVASPWGRRSVDRGPDGGDGGPLDYGEDAPPPGSPFLRQSPEEYAAAKLAHLRVSPNSVLELKHAAEAASLEESYAGAQDRVKDRTLPPTISSEMFYGSSHDSPLHPSALDAPNPRHAPAAHQQSARTCTGMYNVHMICFNPTRS